MVEFEDYTLVFIGGIVTYDGTGYYTTSALNDVIEGLSAEFGETIYLCIQQESKAVDNFSKLDHTSVSIISHEGWDRKGVIQKLAGLRKEIRILFDIDGPLITYYYYPGFYPFLLTLPGYHLSEYQVAYFGSDAEESATIAYGDSLLGRMKLLYYQLMQRYVLTRADSVIATDPRMMEAFDEKADHLVESAPVIEFGPGDLEDTTESADQDPVWLLFVGVFRPVKGLEHLLEAFAKLRDRGKRDYRLRLVGDGARRETLEDQASQLDIDAFVEFTGYIGDKERLSKYYEESDIFVIPSLKESVPRVTYEAGAKRLPVVATRVGGIPDFLEPRENGLLVEPGDSRALADAIEELATNRELRMSVARNLQSDVKTYLEADPVEQRLELFRERLN